MRRRLAVKWMLFAIIAGVALLSACSGTRREGLSPRVEFLWRQHPNPHAEEQARTAAQEAKTLLRDHDDDIELHFYYQDRLREYEPDSLEREYRRRLDRDPDNAVNIILEAHVKKSGVNLTRVMDAALARDSTTAEVLALGAIAMMGKRPPDSVRAMALARRAVTLHPGSYQAHLAQAQVLRRYGSEDEALQEARRAGELNPWRYESVAMEDNILEHRGESERGISLIEQFHAEQPAHVPSYHQLSRYYEEHQQWRKQYDLEMSISHYYPEGGNSFYYAAVAAQRLGDFDLIFDAYTAAGRFGFFDMDYATRLFDEEQLRQFEQNPRYTALVELFNKNHAAAEPKRREQALDHPINVRVRNFDAVELRGRPVSLDDLKGRIVVLDFWSSTEQTHRLAVKRLAELRTRYPEVELVSVDVLERYSKETLLENVAKAARQQRIDWTVWVGDKDLADRMRVKMLPVFAVIDAGGVARYRIQGYHPYVDEMLGYMIEAAEHPVQAGETEQ